MIISENIKYLKHILNGKLYYKELFYDEDFIFVLNKPSKYNYVNGLQLWKAAKNNIVDVVNNSDFKLTNDELNVVKTLNKFYKNEYYKESTYTTNICINYKDIKISLLAQRLNFKIEKVIELIGDLFSKGFYVLPKHSYDYIYLFRMKGTDYFKIGVSSNPFIRKYNIETSSPIEIELLFIHNFYGNIWYYEKTLHQLFDKYRVQGEWFKLSGKNLIYYTIRTIFLLKDFDNQKHGEFTEDTVPILGLAEFFKKQKFWNTKLRKTLIPDHNPYAD